MVLITMISTNPQSTTSSISTNENEKTNLHSSQRSETPRSQKLNFPCPCGALSSPCPSRLLEVISGHTGSVSCLALCGEFVLSASHGNDIIAWQQPDLRQFARFGRGEGTVKALVVMGSKIFTAHQDMRIRVWKVSRSSENVFKLLDTLPTTKDFLVRSMSQSNYVQTRRHHKKLWIEHADSISCLAVANGLIYSGSWDKTIKVWSISNLKCLESIKAHDDAINALVAKNDLVYSASADGKVKAWKNMNNSPSHSHQHRLEGFLDGHKDVSINTIVVLDDKHNELVYAGGSDGFVMGWKGEEDCDEEDCDGWKWKMVCEMKAHEMAVLCLCTNGEYLCSGSADKTICIWKREENGGIHRIGILRGHQGPVKCLQASLKCVGGGFLLYSGSLDRSLRVWWVSMGAESRDETKDGDHFSRKVTFENQPHSIPCRLEGRLNIGSEDRG